MAIPQKTGKKKTNVRFRLKPLNTIFLFNKMEGYIQLFTTSYDLVFQTSHKKIDIMINKSYTHCFIINDCASHNMFS